MQPETTGKKLFQISIYEKGCYLDSADKDYMEDAFWAFKKFHEEFENYRRNKKEKFIKGL